MNDCLFCKIINKEIPSEIVYEDEHVIAFKDINPVAPVHILVIPKEHIVNVNEITKENSIVIAKIFTVIADLAEKNNIAKDGYRVITNTGEFGGQVINHLHFHLIGGKKLGPKIVE